ncbi:IS66 family insertion sequence element accessory protein TnpA [Methylotenera sp. L2L1]|jgi:ABC-type uncharacterized transport system involved in gliding motility auxiliary subunit|uniref:IS66 family insertion sequence element accessory protein TnpA n=1 Tax=Methylotenera sp. L2L1 TaxID=1502770 RepID=UPI00056B42D6|nr:hypothetical protein [Methylotenera sp. L2L1]MDD2833721.1 hypothetical protein [Methylotenera sp.]HOY86705.1 hypothetical protein [Methylotenera sp.]HPM49688.1 hypothetical protein [Methylotenera sp.]
MQSEQNTKRWFDHIEAWQQSGINQSEYCRRHKLCIKSFSSWKLKRTKLSQETLKTSDADIPVFTSSSASMPLIPVAIYEQMGAVTETEPNAREPLSSGFSGITLIFKNDYQISLAIGFHPATLKNVLQVFAE